MTRLHHESLVGGNNYEAFIIGWRHRRDFSRRSSFLFAMTC
jgi:hypothetical protein